MSKKFRNFLQDTKNKAQELEKEARDYINNDAKHDIDKIVEKTKEYAADIKEVFFKKSEPTQPDAKFESTEYKTSAGVSIQEIILEEFNFQEVSDFISAKLASYQVDEETQENTVEIYEQTIVSNAVVSGETLDSSEL